jgi:hypothetical protein
MTMASKKSKTISLTISKETIEDNLSAWLTATRHIGKNQYVSHIDWDHRDPDNYEVEVIGGSEEEDEAQEA